MALNNYTFGTVRKIIAHDNKDAIGDDSVLALVEAYPTGGLDIYTVPTSLKSVVQEDDMVVLDTGLGVVPNTTSTGVKKEIAKVIRNETRKAIDNIYRDRDSKKPKTQETGYTR